MKTKKRKALAIIIAITLGNYKNKAKRTWPQKWLRERCNAGIYQNLLQELRLQDEKRFRRYLRINTDVDEVKSYELF